MTSTHAPPAAASAPASLRSWRPAVSLAAIAGGSAVIAGSFLPWASAFAGLIIFRGTSAENGRILAVAGLIMVLAGGWHLIRGSSWSRWTAGLAGFAATGFAAYLLLRLLGDLRSMGSDSMIVLRGGPGLWVVVAGGLAGFATLFLPASEQRTLRAASPGRGLIAWAADRESAGLRRRLQLALGLIWLLDGALQLQPYMFGRSFVTQIIDGAAMGSPAFLSSTVMNAGQVMLTHLVLWNALFASIQLVLGAGLLLRRTTRAALAGTIAWGLAVWFIGESLGGLLSGGASPVTGAPGGAPLYVLLAILLWPGASGAASAAAGGPLGARWSRLAWVALWGGFAALMLQPQVRAPGAISQSISGLADGEPGWLAAIDRGLGRAVGSGGPVPALILALIFAVVAAGVLVPRLVRPAVVLAVVVALAAGVLGQDLGGLFTGTATDPGTGPLLILLALAFWPARLAAGEVSRPEVAGAAAEVEGEARPEREIAALAVQVPAGAAGAPDGPG
jgi:hypothetical protein